MVSPLYVCAAAAKSLQRPHRLQPTRLRHPWDSPGKNTRVGCHFLLQCMKGKVEVKSLSRVRLCDPRDSSPPGSPVPGILQAKTLEWVAISLSNAWKWKMKVKSFSRVRLLVTPRTEAYQALPSKDFSRQEYWSGVPLQDQCIYLSFFLKFIYFNWRLITL